MSADDQPKTPSFGTDGPHDAGENSDTDEIARLRREFWLLVVCFDLALLAAGVGVLLVVFDQGPDLGFELLATGLILGSYGYVRYRWGPRADLSGKRQS